MAERQFGPYRLIRQIAVGGMAEIHLAKTAGIAGFEKYVALKMIHPNFAEDDQFIQMLVDEAKIAVQLTHGNIAQTFDLGRVGDTYYITMEYVDGADLYKILRRASEQDREMPLDVCAFVGKEISSALDHAHRKRDHTGRSLGIVHRDVSPQNVLVSYSGEVKLVDFGIAKATMKARQTAVGVIKGKYYYMSPEQAWGDPIDHRSDIFSAGIVLYEMITGQMLYLEEDLHKLLEMARAAEIRPPGALRRGVPPQLERIVMHALDRSPDQRYQTAGDLATDLERFLHAYSPVFTASKLSALLREVVGDPLQVPDDPGVEIIEFRDGVMSTHPLDDAEVARAIDRDELRDENSVIYRVAELQRPKPADPPAPAPRPPPPSRPMARVGPPAVPPPPRPIPPPAPRPSAQLPSLASLPGRLEPGAVPKQIAPRVTRATDPMPPRAGSSARLPSIIAHPSGPTRVPQIIKPRQANEETRQLEQAAPAGSFHEDSSSGLLPVAPVEVARAPRRATAPAPEVSLEDSSDLGTDEFNIGDRTVVTGAPGMGFMIDVDTDGQIEATVITGAPTDPGFAGDEESTAQRRAVPPAPAAEFGREHPTRPSRPMGKTEPPAALAANIHAPAVSELRRPRPSRRTPPSGVPSSHNVLHAIVSSQVSEPMPAPRPPPSAPAVAPPGLAFPQTVRPAAPHSPTEAFEAPLGAPAPPSDPARSTPFPVGTPGGHAFYNTDASGLPLGVPTPPGLQPLPLDHSQQFQSYPQGYPGDHMATQLSPQGYPQLSPAALYQFQPQDLSGTVPLGPFESDELHARYRQAAARRRLLTYVVSGALAVSLAAAATFLIIRSMRDGPAVLGSVRVESVPANAEVLFDGTRLPDRTPMTIPRAPLGTRHTIRVELPHYEAHDQQVEVPKQGGEVVVMASLRAIADKILVESVPPNAEIRINGALRGRTPTTINDIDRESAMLLELRLRDYQPYVKNLKDLAWPADGKLRINAKLVR